MYYTNFVYDVYVSNRIGSGGPGGPVYSAPRLAKANVRMNATRAVKTPRGWRTIHSRLFQFAPGETIDAGDKITYEGVDYIVDDLKIDKVEATVVRQNCFSDG